MKYYKVKVTKRYGGGGDTTVQNVPDWAKPYIEKAMTSAGTAYESGDLGKVAGTSGLQGQAFDAGAGALSSATGAGMDTLTDQQARLTGMAQSGVDTTGAKGVLTTALPYVGEQLNRSIKTVTAGPKIAGAQSALTALTPSVSEQLARQTAAAQTGGYDTTGLKNAAILDAQMKTANLGNQYGAGGTLGSARQGVAQAAENAATSAKFADIDRAAAQQNFENKQKAEAGVGNAVTAGTNLVGAYTKTGLDEYAAKLAGENNVTQAITSGANLAKDYVGMGTTEATSKLAAEAALGKSVGDTSSLATSAGTGLSTLGASERAIDQQQQDAAWQGLQRYASTVYGSPAKQTQSSGGK